MRVKIELKNDIVGGKEVWEYWIWEDDQYLIGEGKHYSSSSFALSQALIDKSDAEDIEQEPQ